MKTKNAFLWVGVILIFACSKSKLKTPQCDGSHPTYTSTIKAIIDANCTSSNCHPGYSTYSGLNVAIQTGDFKREVITNMTMPKNKDLTQDQLNKIQCWVENGYPEN
jgi:hypothetical protein